MQKYLKNKPQIIMQIYFRITLLFVLFSTSLQGQWDVYQNLDFSQNAQDSMSGKAYWRTPSNVTVTPDFQDEKRQKNPCIKISGTYTGDQTGYVYQQYLVSVKEYRKLRISAKIKGVLTEGKGYIYSYTKKGEQWRQYQVLQEDAVKGTADWKEVSLEIWVDPDADRLRIGGAIEGAGSLWLDDFEIEELPVKDCPLDTKQLAFMKECMDIIGQYSLYKEQLEISVGSFHVLLYCQVDIMIGNLW